MSKLNWRNLPAWKRAKLEDRVRSREITAADLRIQRLWTLSNLGWYILLFKLSVHFTRMSEVVARKDT